MKTGIIDFTENQTKAVVRCEDDTHPIFNDHKIVKHTFGYPMMAGNIGGIYTTFKAGTKVSFFTTAKGDAICTEVVF